MADRPPLTIACSLGPLTGALADPALHVPDLAVPVDSLPATELFARVVGGAPFDVAELSLANFVMAVAAGDRRFVGLPIFPFRSFRQSMLWVAAGSDITDMAQLRGRRIGINAYSNAALVWLRGLLADEHDIPPEAIDWVRIGADRVAFTPPPGLRIADAPGVNDLFELLETGRADAVAAFWHPAQASETRGARRLFADPAATEADYYRRTGIFPIMHLVVMRRDLCEARPALAARIARLFAAAKQRHEAEIIRFGAERIAITPWSPLELEQAQRLLGDYLHPYGIAWNGKAL